MTALQRLAADELARPAPDAAHAMAAAIVAEHGTAVACILFYGSRRRDGDNDGLLDLYVLFDRHRAFHRRRVAAMGNWLLPPNVMFMTTGHGDAVIRAKVAVMSRRQFASRMRAASLDTTIWTRFCQPASLLYARDLQVADWTAATIATGLRTASGWARQAALPGASSAQRWRALFARTYRLELRPEAGDRSALVYAAAPEWFDAISAVADAEPGAGTIVRSWKVRRSLGKPLNLLRLVKAAFTFTGGADYLAGKLARHTGITVLPTEWQQRHPLLGAPSLLLRHRKAKSDFYKRRASL